MYTLFICKKKVGWTYCISDIDNRELQITKKLTKWIQWKLLDWKMKKRDLLNYECKLNYAKL